MKCLLLKNIDLKLDLDNYFIDDLTILVDYAKFHN